MSAHPFNVYSAGETLTGTDISMHYVWVTQVLPDEKGHLRLTNEEARAFGRSLIAAADYNEMPEDLSNG